MQMTLPPPDDLRDALRAFPRYLRARDFVCTVSDCATVSWSLPRPPGELIEAWRAAVKARTPGHGRLSLEMGARARLSMATPRFLDRFFTFSLPNVEHRPGCLFKLPESELNELYQGALFVTSVYTHASLRELGHTFRFPAAIPPEHKQVPAEGQ